MRRCEDLDTDFVYPLEATYETGFEGVQSGWLSALPDVTRVDFGMVVRIQCMIGMIRRVGWRLDRVLVFAVFRKFGRIAEKHRAVDRDLLHYAARRFRGTEHGVGRHQQSRSQLQPFRLRVVVRFVLEADQVCERRSEGDGKCAAFQHNAELNHPVNVLRACRAIANYA